MKVNRVGKINGKRRLTPDIFLAWFNNCWQWLLLLAIAAVFAAGVEFFYNLPAGHAEDYEYIPIEDILYKNFNLAEGSVFVSDGGSASLTFSFEKQFVDKLYFSVEPGSDQSSNFTIEVHSYPLGNSSGEIRGIQDENNYVLRSSWVNIHEVADQITISTEEGSAPLAVSNIAIDNTGNISLIRLIFVGTVAFFIMAGIFLLHSKKELKLERLFLLICLVMGTLCIGAMPAHKVGYDEEIHFGRAYFLPEILAGEETISSPHGIYELYSVTIQNWPMSLPQSEEERKAEDAYWDGSCDEKLNNKEDWVEEENFSFGLSSVCYVFQWMMIQIGKLLHLPFSMIYRLGRLGNLLMYSVVGFFALKHITAGKRILFLLALMPTSFMAAITYSYDAWLNAFTILGIAWFVEEFNRKGNVNYKNCLVYIVAFMVACMAKAVYIPLLLISLIMPKEKFRTVKEHRIYIAVILCCVLLMLGSFVLPVLVSTAPVTGDSRGGDTSVSGQLSFVFSNLIYYIVLLLKNIKDTLFSFAIGSEGLRRMGHLPQTADGVLSAIAVIMVLLTDVSRGEENQTKWYQRGYILLLCFGVICLVWTALYLSYTPVGAPVINGVQGRYYLPVTACALLFLRLPWIRNSMKTYVDRLVVAVLSLIILLPSIYQGILINAF